MPILTLIAWLAFGIAGAITLVGLVTEDFYLIISAIAPALSGAVFLALDRIVAALEAIRDEIAPRPIQPTQPIAPRPTSEIVAEAAGRLPERGFSSRRSRRAIARSEATVAGEGTGEQTKG